MSKKKKQATAEVTTPVTRAPLTGAELLRKATKPVEPELAPIVVAPKAKAVRVLSKADSVEQYLHTLDIYNELSVPEFRDYSGTGELAANTLLSLEAAGLAESKWQKSRTVFRITEAGRARLDQAN